MNGLDYLVIAVTALGAVYGLARGALRMVTSVFSLAAAIYVASAHYTRAGEIAAQQLGLNPVAGAIVGYVAVFALVFAVVELLGAAAVRLGRIIHLAWADRLAGGLVGAALASVFCSLIIMLLTALLPANAPLLRNSALAPHLLAYNQMVLEYIPQEAKDAYKSNRDQLMGYWRKRPAAAPAGPPAQSDSVK